MHSKSHPSATSVSSSGAAHKLSLQNSPKLKPGYVVNMPLVVPSDSDSDGELSGSDSDGEKFSNKEHYFEFKSGSAPFRVKRTGDGKKVRGYVLSSSLKETVSSSAASSSKTEGAEKLNTLVNVFENEAFGRTPEESLKESKDRLAVVVGLNRRESLSKKRNKNLAAMHRLPLDTPLHVKRVSFFWRPHFQEKTPDAKKWKKAKFERVRSWFKKLKKEHANKAKSFRIAEEKTDKMVPYRELRETIKDSKSTQEAVQQVRQHSNPQNTYLTIFDSDVKSLRAEKEGTFSHYDQSVAKHQQQHGQTPVVMSTGYRISEPMMPLLELAVQMDMRVRETTAKVLAQGIYYPEPNMAIKIKPDEKTVTESFCEGKAHYDSPKESPIIINNLVKERKVDVEKSFVFRAQGAVVTETPARFRKMPVSARSKSFSGYPNDEEKIVIFRILP